MIDNVNDNVNRVHVDYNNVSIITCIICENSMDALSNYTSVIQRLANLITVQTIQHNFCDTSHSLLK